MDARVEVRERNTPRYAHLAEPWLLLLVGMAVALNSWSAGSSSSLSSEKKTSWLTAPAGAGRKLRSPPALGMVPAVLALRPQTVIAAAPRLSTFRLRASLTSLTTNIRTSLLR